jgi:phage-related protein
MPPSLGVVRLLLPPLPTTITYYEIRIELGSNIYRIFCCFDDGSVVVLFHGFQKKSQKTPPKEIRRAEAIKKEYFKEKENKK